MSQLNRRQPCAGQYDCDGNRRRWVKCGRTDEEALAAPATATSSAQVTTTPSLVAVPGAANVTNRDMIFLQISRLPLLSGPRWITVLAACL